MSSRRSTSLRTSAPWLLAAGLAAALLLAALTVRAFQRERAATGWVEHTFQVRAALRELHTAMIEAQTAVRGFVLTGHEELLAGLHPSRTQAWRQLAALRRLTADNPVQQSLFERVVPAVDACFGFREAVVAAARASGRPAAEAMIAGGEGTRLQAALTGLLDEMDAVEARFLEQRFAARDAAMAGVWFYAFVTAVISALVLLAWILYRRLLAMERTAAQLRAVHAQLGAVLDAATAVAIIATDPQGTITLFNTGAEKMLGYQAADLVGRRTPEVFHDRAEVEARRRELAAALGRPVDGFAAFVAPLAAPGATLDEREWTYVRRNGSTLTVSLAVTALRDEAGRLHGFLGVAKDITDRCRREHALETASRLKSESLASLSHELRSSLNAIVGFTELLADGKPGPLNERQGGFVAEVLGSARHLLRLIDDLLDLARIEAGQIELRPETVELPALLESCAAAHRPAAAARHIALHAWTAPELPSVHLDRARLRQIIDHLLSNAVAFSHDGGRVDLAATVVNGEQFQVRVVDRGLGIPAEDLPRLFREFQRVHRPENQRRQGVGLGLALTRRLAEAMDGVVRVESTPGEGSAFTVILPLVRAGAPAAA